MTEHKKLYRRYAALVIKDPGGVAVRLAGI